MKCEKCGNEYSSNYYFATPTVCNDCFSKMSDEEQKLIYNQAAMNVATGGYEGRVGFGRRLAAALIDYVIIVAITVTIFSYTGFFESLSEYMQSLQEVGTDMVLAQQLQKEFISRNAGNFYFSIFISLAYFSLELLIAASLGKLILGIQIGSDKFERAGFSKLFTRFMIKHIVNFFSLIWLVTSMDIFNTIGSLLFIIIVIGFFFTLSAKKQAFHDMIAKTAVYKKNTLPEESMAV